MGEDLGYLKLLIANAD